jgi:hypothetical protein
MTYESDLRVVISCVTFDTVKIVEPVKYFRADRVYLFHKADKKPYIDFLDEVRSQLDRLEIENIEIFSDVNKFDVLMPDIIDILKKETGDGNRVFMNIEAGSAIFSSAALIASMMYGAIPFNVGTEKHMIEDYRSYYDDKGRPVGLARAVREPYLLPGFNLEKPHDKLVKGLKIWNEVKTKFGNRKLKETVIRMEKEGLLEDCMERNKVTHSGQMQFRRKYLLKWIDRGWVSKDENNIYVLSTNGKMIVKIF